MAPETPKDLICEIFVPTEGTKDESGSIGTGYPIAANLILTAAHIFDRWDKERPIEVSWHHPAPSPWEKAGEFYLLGGEDADKIDIALLECSVPDHLRPFLPLAKHLPKDGDEWFSQGFAKFGGRDEQQRRRSFAMYGKVLTDMASERQYQMKNVEDLDGSDNWKGVSGSPVIAKGSGSILGVISSFADYPNSSTLRFTPSQRFINDPNLQELMRCDERQKRYRAFRDGLDKLLPKEGELTKALAKAFGCECDAVCKTLLTQDFIAVLDRCEQVYDELAAGSKGKGQAAFGALANHILPAVFDYSVVREVRDHKEDEHHAIFDLPVKIRTLAGVILAAVDGVPFDPQPRRNENEFPHGYKAIAGVAENGFDPDGEALERCFSRHLADKLNPEHASEAFEGHWNDYHARHYTESSDPEAERVQIAVDELTYRSRQDRRTRYFIVESLADEAWHLQQETTFKRLKKIWKMVVFVRLDSQPGLAEEKRRYRWYRDTIPLAEPSDSSALPQEPSKERNNKP